MVFRYTTEGKLEIKVQPESVRVIAYLFFWSFIAFASVLTNLYVVDMLAAGHQGDPETMGCGPFNRKNSTFGLTYGDGFDFLTQNHLAEYFGFNNVCTNWDYTPAREISSVYFPFFEYFLVLYLLLDYVNTLLAYNRGHLSVFYIKMETFFCCLTVFACVQFRQIFVNISYESAEGHTAGFLSLQFGLAYTAINNTFYVITTQQKYPGIGLDTPDKVAKWAKIYLYFNLAISAVKIGATIYIVKYGVGPAFYKYPAFGGKVLGQYVDKVWVFMNAVLPLFIAYIRMQQEDSLTITIDVSPDESDSGDGGPTETDRLIN